VKEDCCVHSKRELVFDIVLFQSLEVTMVLASKRRGRHTAQSATEARRGRHTAQSATEARNTMAEAIDMLSVEL
jgi:hypothetical protein